ncbi:MAG: carbohydrate binding family 9 domain-containing protein [Saprospiraceae bacterium]|nr:carbohydrate binding family 9 domain-containing protein [Saprospiraceae bacterium]
MKAKRIFESITIDGKLNEVSWSGAAQADQFTMSEPTPGEAASFDTRVYFLYDDNAVYIGARMHDPQPDKILTELSLRDQVGNADNFRVFFDTYRSGLNGFKFYVTASGVQFDAVVSNHVDDLNWNAVWESAVSRDDEGWYAELRIPYSSLRFPAQDIQEWNVQFGREIRRFRESSFWSPIDPTVSGWVQQSGTVTEINKITTPVRLSLTPYVSTYLNTSYEPSAAIGSKFSSGTAYSAGLDLKYGINDAFTLDMTLVPDFGQVISDKQVLNLSPFEVFFAENRQFFTEGTELFNKGRMFYSRRIGGQPLHFNDVYQHLREGESVIDNPGVTQLINATKITGRTSGGTGIGGFNAMVGESFATLRDAEGKERRIQTSPFTNYNALVIDQNLKNNSFITLMNTNVYRLGSDQEANVTGAFFNFKTKDQRYFFSGDGMLSQQFYTDRTRSGYTYHANAGKGGGNWTYEAGHGVESENFDPNDLGFIYAPNEWYLSGKAAYTQYSPKHPKLQQYSMTMSSIYSRLFKPFEFTGWVFNLSSFVLWKTRTAAGLNARIDPVTSYDYFEPRTQDLSRFLIIPGGWQLGGFISTDYRKKAALDVNLSYRDYDAQRRYTTTLSISPRFRFNDRFSLIPNLGITQIKEEPGYVHAGDNGLDIGPEDIFMGVRDRIIIDNALTGRFIFNSVMGINARIRHYWDHVEYNRFGLLQNDGNLETLAYDGKDAGGKPIFDRNVNIFNVDLQYNWRFAPGSDIIFVWKNQVYTSGISDDENYFRNLDSVFQSAQANNFSIRVIYYLDYLYLFPRKSIANA